MWVLTFYFYLPCWQDPRLTDFLWMQRENKEQSQVSDVCYFPERYNITGKADNNCSKDPRIVRVRACVTVALCRFTVGTQKQKSVWCLRYELQHWWGSAFLIIQLFVRCKYLSIQFPQCPLVHHAIHLWN